MPYYGLLDDNGNEITGAGYHRLDVAQARFVVAPPQQQCEDVTFINLDLIAFAPAEGHWGEVGGLAIYDEADSKQPMISAPIARAHVLHGDSMAIRPGQLRFGHRFYRRDGDDAPFPELGEEIEEIVKLRREITDLKIENARLRQRLHRALNLERP